MLRTKLALAFVAMLALCTVAEAESIRLKDGTRISGQATEYNADTETLSWREDSGNVRQLKLADLDTRSSYSVLRSQVAKDNGPGQLQLANYTRDIELWAHAVRHYGYAKEADPSLAPEVDKQVEILKQKAAKWGMQKAREAAAKGDRKEALEWLQKIITKLPDQPEAAEAQRLIDDYYASVKAEETKEVDNSQDEMLKKELADGKKAYDKMLDMNKKGLQSKSGATSVRDWESAIKEGNKAVKEIDKFAKKSGDTYKELLDGYRDTVNEQIVEIYMNLASHYATRSSYNKAQDQVNLALSVDPGNADALAMRARIQDAASRGLGWY